jgi:Na+-translocating ferredoxin:NAD+ oxidoreductase RnfG subunit
MSNSWAKTYLSIDQAKLALLPNETLSPHDITLTDEQRKSIAKASKVRVRSKFLRAWKSDKGNWFIVDQIIGKHENIDMAFAIDNKGVMLGLEILTYRESYGHEIRHPKWRAQFSGKTAATHLKLDRNIKNISGATLSCAHVTDGVNRLLHTWQQVLSL